MFWLWLTVVLGNFAEALAEGRGKAQTASLRSTKDQLVARRIGKRNLAPERRELNLATLRRRWQGLAGTHKMAGDLLALCAKHSRQLRLDKGAEQLHLHDVRGTCATRLILAGSADTEVAEAMG